METAKAETMTKQELLNCLLRSVTKEEWEQLERGDRALYIGEYNRRTMLEARSFAQTQGNWETETARIPRVQGLVRQLEEYLGQYMADHPEGHRWIIFCCVYLAFVREIPMHPQEIVKYTITQDADGIHYHCPSRTEEEGSVCLYCAADLL